jgi:RNA polymerase sigma factor (sigma-70 family)
VQQESELNALMDRLVDGDRSAFEPLYRALHPRAVRFATMRLGSAAAEDVAQSALQRVFARAAEFERGRPVLPWFYAITANEIRAAARQARPVEALGDEAIAADDPEVELGAREALQALERAISALDEDSAEAIRAVLDRGPRPDVSPATFRKRVSRAYARLRAVLGSFA